MNRKLIISSGLFGLFIITVILYFSLLDAGTKNYRHFKKLEIGMPEKEALKVIGEPDYILDFNSTDKAYYCYLRPRYLLSDDMKVVINKQTRKVEALIEPE